VSIALLKGFRVIDLAGEPGAQAGRILSDLGAEVVMVEPPGGSPARSVPPLVAGPDGEVISAHFVYMAAGKRSVTLDLAGDEGYGLFRDLVAVSDVVLVTAGTDELRERRLDYESLRRLNEGIVYASVTAFGSSGPRRSWRGSDLVAWASSGIMVSIGDEDRRPVAPGGGLAYAAGSLNAVAATVLALRSRARTGRGQQIDISLQEAVLSVTMDTGPFFPLEGGSQARVGARRGPAQGHFPARDGFVELLPYMPGQWDSLAEWISEDLGIHEATMDVFKGSIMARAPFGELINGWVEQLSSRYTKQEFFVEAQRRGIPCGPVNEPVDLLSDPQLEAVGGWVEQDLGGLGSLRWPRPPLRFSGEGMGTGAVPAVGEHNDAVLGGVLGVQPERLDLLRRSGCI